MSTVVFEAKSAGPYLRKAMSKKLRFDVFKRDSFLCQYCGAHPPKAVLEVDHITPVASGGTNDIDNLITACFPCNRGKGAGDLASVPQSLADKAAQVAEQEAQIRGYQDILRAKKDRLDADCGEVSDLIAEHFNVTGVLKADFQSIKVFVEKLGVVVVLEAMEKAIAKMPRSERQAFRYFCGICWSKIKGE